MVIFLYLAVIFFVHDSLSKLGLKRKSIHLRGSVKDYNSTIKLVKIPVLGWAKSEAKNTLLAEIIGVSTILTA